MARQERRPTAATLPQPLRGAASMVRRVPGAGLVGRAAEEALDKVGAVSPRGRRLAVYAGAGVLGVAGVVEWPVAITGAAVAWLTQPRPGERGQLEDGGAASAGLGADGEREGGALAGTLQATAPGTDSSADASVTDVPVDAPVTDTPATDTPATDTPTDAPASATGLTPPAAAGTTQPTGPADAAPEVLGGGGPLVDPDAPSSPDDRTTG
jgi:hypothetical protein